MAVKEAVMLLFQGLPQKSSGVHNSSQGSSTITSSSTQLKVGRELLTKLKQAQSLGNLWSVLSPSARGLKRNLGILPTVEQRWRQRVERRHP